MDWQQAHQAMTDRERESFARLVSVLYEQTFLLRETWDAKEGRFVSNRDYRFAERTRELLDTYLAVSGFALQVDGQNGVMALYNRFGRNRQGMDKVTTYFLYVLRLMYEEAMEQVSTRREVIVSLRDILEKLHALGVADKRIGTTVLYRTLQLLRRLCAIERIDGELTHPDTRFVIYPTLRILVSEERISTLYDGLSSGRFGESSNPDGGLWSDDPDGEGFAVDDDEDVSLAGEEVD